MASFPKTPSEGYFAVLIFRCPTSDPSLARVPKPHPISIANPAEHCHKYTKNRNLGEES